MNVQTVNPFAFAAADGAANPAASGTVPSDAAAAFASLLANMVTGVEAEPEPSAGELPIDETAIAVDDEVEADDNSDETTAPSLWLPEGMVTVAAPLLGSASATVQPTVAPEVSAETTAMPVTATAVTQAPTASSEVSLPISIGNTPEEAPALPSANSAALDPVVPKDVVAAAPVKQEIVTASGEPSQADELPVIQAALRTASTSTLVESEVENKPTSDSKQVVQELLAKGNAVAASEPVQTASQVEADKLSKKAQQREFAARLAAAGDDSVDGSPVVDESAVPSLRAVASPDGESVSDLRLPAATAGASEASTTRRFDEVLVDKRDEAGATDASRQVTPSVSHKDNVATATARPVAAATPVEVPVTELPKMTESSIKQMLDSGEQRMSIRIKPDTLGEMQIEVTRSGSDVQVRLTAATQAVRDMLDSHAPQLREALAREGFDAARIQVSPPSSSAGLNLGHAGAGQQGQHAQQQQQQQGGQAWWSGARLNGAASPSSSSSQTRPSHANAGGAALNITV